MYVDVASIIVSKAQRNQLHPQIQLFQLYESNYCNGVRWYDNLFPNSYHHKVRLESDEHLMLPGINENLWINTNRLEDIDKVFGRIAEVNKNQKL